MPPVVLERPKMSREMWDALKSQIVRERQRKKEELEADAEVERQRKERERQQKQDSMTLSETKEQIAVLEVRLSELKEEKHQVFLQLKKVLNEDEVRKRQLMSQEQSSGEIFGMNRGMGGYQQMQLPQAGGQMFLQQVTMTRPPTAVYKGVAVSHQPPHSSHTLLPPGTLKRSRSPSPPPQSNNYKFGPYKPPPHALHPYPHKPAQTVSGIQFFPSQGMQQPQPPPPHSTPTPPSFSTQHHPSSAPSQGQGTIFTYAGAPPSRSPQSAPPSGREEPPKHTAIYLPHSASVARGYVMHPSVEVRTHTPPPQKFGDDGPKYYSTPSHPIRNSTHMTIHPSGLTIQASPQTISTGSITAGYPIRTQPSATSFQGRSSSPHISYSGPPGAPPPRLAYGHPHIQASAHPNAPRYSIPPGLQRDRD